jgi:hypothetical protein
MVGTPPEIEKVVNLLYLQGFYDYLVLFCCRLTRPEVDDEVNDLRFLSGKGQEKIAGFRVFIEWENS